MSRLAVNHLRKELGVLLARVWAVPIGHWKGSPGGGSVLRAPGPKDGHDLQEALQHTPMQVVKRETGKKTAQARGAACIQERLLTVQGVLKEAATYPLLP
eukprot:1158214-Pelagomonas_calceolata.AAC.8